ncbi:MAG: YkuJ family protein [Planctomycetia bacterium]|nr:YkuJ family protein [Planctomycetia bacterium]
MEPSQLKAIITRLEAMTADDSSVDVRKFEKDGAERCTVTFDRERQMFLLDDHSENEDFEFDDIDLVAMEIYDLIQ